MFREELCWETLKHSSSVELKLEEKIHAIKRHNQVFLLFSGCHGWYFESAGLEVHSRNVLAGNWVILSQAVRSSSSERPIASGLERGSRSAKALNHADMSWPLEDATAENR